MSFSICRGTLGSLAMFTAIRNSAFVGTIARLLVRQPATRTKPVVWSAIAGRRWGRGYGVLPMSESDNEWSKVLSPREHQIAVLVGRGLSNKDIARELGLSLSTVRIHVHNIFQKLGERSRYGLIVHYGTRIRPVAPGRTLPRLR
jgi:DNA-binding NarL/FixJ family response regulator